MLKKVDGPRSIDPDAASMASDPTENSAVRSKWRRLLSAVILLAFFAWAGWYGYRHWQELSALGDVPWWVVMTLCAATAGTVVCNGLYIKFVLSAFGIDLPAKEWIALTVATSLLNFISPMRGGSAMRAVYLKARYRFSFTDFVSSLGAMYLMYAAVHAFLGLCGSALLWQTDNRPPLALTAFFAAVAVASVLLMVAPIHVPQWSTFGLRHLVRVLEGWALLRRSPRVFAALLVVTVAYALLSVLQFKIAFAGIDVSAHWGSALFYTAGQGLALLITITPGALGIAEWTGVYLGAMLSFTPAQVLMVQLLVRASYIFVLMFASLFAMRFLMSLRSPATPTSATSRASV